jgi:ABC-type polar amino acid transport system ATPase subunit
LLLDKITSALDPELVGEVLNLVGELAATGSTIVMVTHELDFARDVADTVAFSMAVGSSNQPRRKRFRPIHSTTRRAGSSGG